MPLLRLNDPVHVERDSQQQLEGVVAYVGPVKFAEGDDWVGVQLTGLSVGQGKNDGTVQGEQYFSCGPGCGVFVRAVHVIPRTLSRLEEVRLKKELFAPRAAAGTTGAFSGSPRKTAPATATATAKSPAVKEIATVAAKTPTTSTQSRLDEIRARRAALTADRSSLPSSSRSGTSSPKPPPTATSATSSRATSPEPMSHARDPIPEESSTQLRQQQQENTANPLQIQVLDLQANLASLQRSLELVSAKLKTREEEAAALQQSLSKAEQDAHNNKQLVDHLKDQLLSKEQTVVQVSSDKMHEQVEELQARESKMQAVQSELNDTIEKLQLELKTTRLDLSQERRGRVSDIQELTKARAELATTQHELNAINSQAASRSTSDASHYKERAKLQAELGAIKRANEVLQAEKLDLEAALEDLTLDKEQLLEEKEGLVDRVDEFRIDAETAQMELEELKAELEEAKQGGGSSSSIGDTDETAQALATQNARLREALIRLREQASYEKIEISRQLRVAEKEGVEIGGLKKELEELKALKVSLEEQNEFLKETVDQGSAFETMVEDLSDQVMALEDTCVVLQSTIREMEEAADIAAELEEVQAEEVKSLMIDLEGRDSIVRNLEEAIKMQRRREEDFQRTVGNYRKSVETLKQEKNELLAMQRGGEGEKSEIIATSQKALTRAAQLVADAAKARKREAEHAFERVEGNVQRHLSTRVESMLPQSVVAGELVAIKGELLLCNIVGKASMTLDSLATAFSKTIRSGMNEAMAAEDAIPGNSTKIAISDEAAQDIQRIFHETKFSLSTIGVSSDLLRLLAAGQWPDLLSPEQSSDLGSACMHSLSDLNFNMGSTLKILKEEGVLSPHGSNLCAFQQSAQTASQAFENVRNADGKPLLPDEWSPPAWKLFQIVSTSKFCCLGSGAALATALNDDQSESNVFVKSILKTTMTKMERVASEASRIGSRISLLDVSNAKVVAELENAALEWKTSSEALVESVEGVFSDKGKHIELESLAKCESTADAVLKALALFMTSLRTADLNTSDELAPHALSAECLDPWTGITSLARAIRSVDGDADDVNFVVRTSTIEHRLLSAIENEPKLGSANNRIAVLEKNLSSRAKEIAMQSARLSELEKLLAKSSVQGPSRVQKSATVTDELMKLKEENRVLTDAVDVMQQQVDDYESELRMLKDPKSPKARMSMGSTARRILAIPDARRGEVSSGVEASPVAMAALQATLFRPAMDSIRCDAASWKANAVAKNMLSLPPLTVLGSTLTVDKSNEQSPWNEVFSSFEAAGRKLRLEKASFRLVDLTVDAPPRSQLLGALSRVTFAEERLRVAAVSVSSILTNKGDASIGIPQELGDLLGRIKFTGVEPHRKLPLAMTKEGMARLHSQLMV